MELIKERTKKYYDDIAIYYVANICMTITVLTTMSMAEPVVHHGSVPSILIKALRGVLSQFNQY
jgi:hypothetical protein